MTINSNFPHRKSFGITEEMAVRLAEVVEHRSMTESYVMRDLLDSGLDSWKEAQAPKVNE